MRTPGTVASRVRGILAYLERRRVHVDATLRLLDESVDIDAMPNKRPPRRVKLGELGRMIRSADGEHKSSRADRRRGMLRELRGALRLAPESRARLSICHAICATANGRHDRGSDSRADHRRGSRNRSGTPDDHLPASTAEIGYSPRQGWLPLFNDVLLNGVACALPMSRVQSHQRHKKSEQIFS